MYEVAHKSDIFVPNDRTVIFVGDGDNKKQYLRDNTLDNISNKNKNFCELTALYWIWKNDTSSDYISIEHYRRYFMHPILPKIISKKKINKYFKDFDVITTRLYRFPETIEGYYNKNHEGTDLNKVKDILEKKYPDYLPAYKHIMQGKEASMCNMAAMSKQKFDEYCTWLFDVLFELEKNLDITTRNQYQQRVYGFISERLFNVWIQKNDLRIKRLPIYYLEDSKVKSVLKSLKHRRAK